MSYNPLSEFSAAQLYGEASRRAVDHAIVVKDDDMYGAAALYCNDCDDKLCDIEDGDELGTLLDVISVHLTKPPTPPDLTGRTIAAVDLTEVPSDNGPEPATRLTFTDGTSHLFIHPAD